MLLQNAKAPEIKKERKKDVKVGQWIINAPFKMFLHYFSSLGQGWYPIRKNGWSPEFITMFPVRSGGLVVKEEDSWLRGPGFKPSLCRPFFRHHSFGSKLGSKIVGKL